MPVVMAADKNEEEDSRSVAVTRASGKGDASEGLEEEEVEEKEKNERH